MRNIRAYTRETLSALRQRPSLSTLGFALRYGAESLRLVERGQPDFLALGKPWMCFPAIDWLDRVLKPDARVFEYGSGGSTIYFARTNRKVISIEHEASWYQLVRAELEKRGLQIDTYKLVEPTPHSSFDPGRISDPLAYVSADDKSAGCSYETYAKAIDQYPDGHFDLVVVDGRARPSCLLHAMPKVRVGGILLLDQSERSYYLAEMPALLDKSRWTLDRFMAPLPYSLHFTEASFFTKTRP